MNHPTGKRFRKSNTGGIKPTSYPGSYYLDLLFIFILMNNNLIIIIDTCNDICLESHVKIST